MKARKQAGPRSAQPGLPTPPRSLDLVIVLPVTASPRPKAKAGVRAKRAVSRRAPCAVGTEDFFLQKFPKLVRVTGLEKNAVEAILHVRLWAGPGQRHQERAGRLRLLPQPSGDLAATQARQAQVQEDQFRTEGASDDERGRPVSGYTGVVPPHFEKELCASGGIWAVFDDKDVQG